MKIKPNKLYKISHMNNFVFFVLRKMDNGCFVAMTENGLTDIVGYNNSVLEQYYDFYLPGNESDFRFNFFVPESDIEKC